jgi:hypothetical protein
VGVWARGVFYACAQTVADRWDLWDSWDLCDLAGQSHKSHSVMVSSYTPNSPPSS